MIQIIVHEHGERLEFASFQRYDFVTTNDMDHTSWRVLESEPAAGPIARLSAAMEEALSAIGVPFDSVTERWFYFSAKGRYNGLLYVCSDGRMHVLSRTPIKGLQGFRDGGRSTIQPDMVIRMSV